MPMGDEFNKLFDHAVVAMGIAYYSRSPAPTHIRLSPHGSLCEYNGSFMLHKCGEK